MTRSMQRLGLTAILWCCLACAWAADQPQDRVARWNQDLDYLTAIMRGDPIPGQERRPGQKDFAKLYPHFDADIATLRSQVASINDGAIYWRLARIMGSAGVAHNMLVPGDAWRLPLDVAWLKEGPVVIAASAGMQDLIGMQVIRVGDLDAAAYLQRVSPYLAYETQDWQKMMAAQVVPRRALLRELGVAEGDRVAMTFKGPAGAVARNLEFVSMGTQLVSAREAFNLPVPLTDSQPDQKYYWSRHLADSSVLYIQYRQCWEDPALPMRTFASRVDEQIRTLRPRRVIVDLRFNGGGNSRVMEPLLKVLVAHKRIIGKPYVLAGTGTFSSGVMAITALRDNAGAVVVGAAAGGVLGGYGELRETKLPNSGLGIGWTIKNFGKVRVISPDLPVVNSLDDLRAGRDAMLEAAISH